MPNFDLVLLRHMQISPINPAGANENYANYGHAKARPCDKQLKSLSPCYSCCKTSFGAAKIIKIFLAVMVTFIV